MPEENNLKVVIIIPARYQSTRLPGKPLLDICGKSMIQRTYDRCCQALSSTDIFVATDDDRIVRHCLSNNINVVMTPYSCKTGTDRVFEASKKIEADVYINVQGDEPIINPKDIRKVIEASRKNPNIVINAMCPIGEEDFNNRNIPKVVFREDGQLLYASRVGIPSTKNMSYVFAYKQVCIYAFSKQALSDFANVSRKTVLEEVEDIEILRFLELGYNVQMVEVSDTSLAVDVPEDVDKVREILNA